MVVEYQGWETRDATSANLIPGAARKRPPPPPPDPELLVRVTRHTSNRLRSAAKVIQ